MTVADTSLAAEPELAGRDFRSAITLEEFVRTGRVTPMVRQYMEIKRAYPDCVLLYRLGDFYECFFEDAHTAAAVLDITLTGRGKGDDRFPMAGIPAHAGRVYIGRLVEAGHKVAICEQVEDAGEAKGLVRREVVQIITPGMIVDDELLDPRAERLLASMVLADEDGGGLAFLELSTGAFRASVFENDASLAEELLRSAPREIVLPAGAEGERHDRVLCRLKSVATSRQDARAFDPREARDRLCRHLRVASLAGFGVPDGLAGTTLIAAAGGALRYVQDAYKHEAVHIDRLEVYQPSSYLILDSATRANLEVLSTLHGGKRAGSLLGLVDKTATAMGGRRLREWVARPLFDLSAILNRQETVEHFVSSPSLCLDLQRSLRGLVDLERLLGRLALGQGNARDLRGLLRSLEAVPTIKERLESALEGSTCSKLLEDSPNEPSLLASISGRLVGAPGLAALLDTALVEDPPPTTRDGGMIRQGFDVTLDELIDLTTSGKDHLLRMEAEERRSTGIGSLKVRHNRVFGYYIDVTKANLHLVPPHYVRKQTTASSERFVTPELQALEEKVLTAEEKRRSLEQRIFEDLRSKVLEAASQLGCLADTIADLDSFVALATVATAYDWRRPDIDESRDMIIEDGRHPVVEIALRREGGTYVPSDLVLESERPMVIVTGPNMAGKSTVMRMAALVVLLAHIGSFVPARRARVGLCDRIFTRVGASDDLAGGRSTFMVEMTESAAILNQATERSLVVLDEIGRGTSTFDGLSIAWAVAEDLHDRVRARCLFATHFHELTDLAKERDGVVNCTVAVREWNDEVVFLRRLVPGAANRSYGIQVARLAGLPKRVLERAAEVLANLETAELDDDGRPALARGKARDERSSSQLSLFAAPRPCTAHLEAVALLNETNPDDLSPREALDLLYRLKISLKAP